MRPFTPTPKDEPQKSAFLAARERLQKALCKMAELADSSIANPALDADYQRAVEDVARAESALKEIVA